MNQLMTTTVTTVTFILCPDCKCHPIAEKQIKCAGCLGAPPGMIQWCSKCSIHPSNSVQRVWYPLCEICERIIRINLEKNVPIEDPPVSKPNSTCHLCHYHPCETINGLCAGCSEVLLIARSVSLEPTGFTIFVHDPPYKLLYPDAVCTFKLDNQTFNSVYQYCQWRKFSGNAAIQQQILQTTDSTALRKMEEQNANQIDPFYPHDVALFEALLLRFMNERHLCILLLETRGNELVYWNEKLNWGTDRTQGYNAYGRMLMMIRRKIVSDLKAYD